jgi:hypothetical protein
LKAPVAGVNERFRVILILFSAQNGVGVREKIKSLEKNRKKWFVAGCFLYFLFFGHYEKLNAGAPRLHAQCVTG